MKKNLLITAALTGLMAVSAKAADSKADAKAGKGEAKGECHGVNSCAKTGECAGKEGNSCKGTNSCKGKGWNTTTEKDCKAKAAKLKLKEKDWSFKANS